MSEQLPVAGRTGGSRILTNEKLKGRRRFCPRGKDCPTQYSTFNQERENCPHCNVKLTIKDPRPPTTIY